MTVVKVLLILNDLKWLTNKKGRSGKQRPSLPFIQTQLVN